MSCLNSKTNPFSSKIGFMYVKDLFDQFGSLCKADFFIICLEWDSLKQPYFQNNFFKIFPESNLISGIFFENKYIIKQITISYFQNWNIFNIETLRINFARVTVV